MLDSSARALGIETNNFAEYTVLISVERFCNPEVTELSVTSDSEFLIKQLQKIYAVKSPKLKELVQTVTGLSAVFAKVIYTHETRDNPYIGVCDWHCNQILDLQDKENLFRKKYPKPSAPPSAPYIHPTKQNPMPRDIGVTQRCRKQYP